MRPLLLLTTLIFVFSSCRKINGVGPILTENRNTDNFSAIALRLSATIYYKQDNDYHVDISAQRNILELIETPVINNELVIRFKNVNLRTHEEIIVTVSAPSVNSFDVSGSGNLYCQGDLTPSNVHFKISGSGDIVVDKLITSNLEASISGSGNIQVVGGTAGHQSLQISGSGSMDLLNLRAKSANSSTSGSGTIKVNLSDRLDARISGSGNLYYKGTPQVTASVSGSGKLIPL